MSPLGVVGAEPAAPQDLISLVSEIASHIAITDPIAC